MLMLDEWLVDENVLFYFQGAIVISFVFILRVVPIRLNFMTFSYTSIILVLIRNVNVLR